MIGGLSVEQCFWNSLQGAIGTVLGQYPTPVDAVKDEIKFPLVLKATKPEIKRLGEYRPEETSQQNF
jgi:hypothetical protein